jgi:hypothetical protein
MLVAPAHAEAAPRGTATLSGRKEGQRTLKVIEPARTAVVDVRFDLGDGESLEGQRLDDPASPLGVQAERVRRAIVDDLGRDPGAVPVHVVKNTDLPKLHRAIGGSLGAGWELSGFAFRGHVFVKRGLVSVPDSVLVHELLHVLSQGFAQVAHGRGCSGMVEGVDQYFTLGVLQRRLKPEAHNRTYVGLTEFAGLLAELVGEERMRRAFFDPGDRGFDALERDFDARRGRGALGRACVALSRKDFQGALRVVAGQ